VPDPSANPYLAFSASDGRIDGIKNKIEPHEPVDKDLYGLPPDGAAAIPQVPGSLETVLNTLEEDTTPAEGGVFTPTSSRPGSSTSGQQARRCPCVRRRTSSRCTTTSRPGMPDW
jgi:hypothetical protein